MCGIVGKISFNSIIDADKQAIKKWLYYWLTGGPIIKEYIMIIMSYLLIEDLLL